MSALYINLGCGAVLIESPDWLNLDFAPVSAHVRKANLLRRWPVASDSASLVYSSHFLEHVPRALVPNVLDECMRVLEPGGVLRLVLPDLENMAREYLAMRDAGFHHKADFVVLEIVDQCVRRQAGGELGKYYQALLRQSDVNSLNLRDFVRDRVGVDLHSTRGRRTFREVGLKRIFRHIIGRLKRSIKKSWIKVCLLAVPAGFRMQNVSFADLGERHHWLWDYHQLRTILEDSGFILVERCSADSSRVLDFPFFPLDLDIDGRPRKGRESMYVEASKPARPNV